MKVCFCGDLFLGGDLLNKSTKNIINVLSFKDADKRIVNLEHPISNNDILENKCTLFTDSSAITQLKELKINAVNLAHNHIQDKGIEGINETIEHLTENKIGAFGAGRNLFESKKPYLIDDNIVVFGYCEYNKPYLKQIEVANENKAGVNPLRVKSILSDLNKLPANKKAILYFHWGREHVFLPTYQDIQLVKKILEDDRVLMIIGMHAHRIQGVIEHKGKKAYMCLGNFLFPNFFIEPPTQIYYPVEKPKVFDLTRQYHSVSKITYKKWRLFNRISLVIKFDTKTFEVSHQPVIQEDNCPAINDMFGFYKNLVLFFVWFLSQIYKLPAFLYIPLEKINTFIVYKIWKIQIYKFQAKQMGYKNFYQKTKKYLLRHLR